MNEVRFEIRLDEETKTLIKMEAKSMKINGSKYAGDIVEATVDFKRGLAEMQEMGGFNVEEIVDHINECFGTSYNYKLITYPTA